nr:retrovirus-related Pol polyprotein from transposon TNT 1-94 [Tanacetum cinerariifolium]
MGLYTSFFSLQTLIKIKRLGCWLFEYQQVLSELGISGYRLGKVLEFFDCLGPRQGVKDLRELLHKVVGCSNINKCYQPGASGYRLGKVLEFFDCLGPRQGVKDLRELLHKGAQGDHNAEVQVSNDNTVVAQRRLKYKQPKEKRNTDCLAKDITRSTYLVIRSPSSAIGFKNPLDMLGFFCWLASIKQGMLEPVKFKCIFLGYHKSIVSNKIWRLDDVTSKVMLYKNMGFNESMEYKKILIGFGVATVVGNKVTTAMAITRSIHQTLLEGHSILSLKGSLSGNCNVEKNGYMTLTNAIKEAIWLKGLVIELGFELKIVAGIATSALSKAIPGLRLLVVRISTSAISQEHEGSILFGLPGSQQKNFLVLWFFDVKEHQGIDWERYRGCYCGYLGCHWLRHFTEDMGFRMKDWVSKFFFDLQRVHLRTLLHNYHP